MRDSSGFSDWASAIWDSEPVTAFRDYVKNGVNDMSDLISGGSYSDFTASRNNAMDGWYSTVMDSVPIVRNIHNALLGRESAKDYLDENGLTWNDAKGYNVNKLTANISNNLGGAIATGSKYLNNLSNDLGKLYAKE